MKKVNLSEDTDKKMLREWRDRGLFESTEQSICDQARAIRKNGWLSQLELETVKRQVEDNFQGEFGEDAATEVERVENEDRQRMKIW